MRRCLQGADPRRWTVLAAGLTCCLALRAARGVGRKLATLKQRPPLIRAPLRCSARPDGEGSPHTACARSLRSPCTRCTRLCARALAPGNAVPAPYPRQAPSVNYNRIVPQSAPTNPHRNLPHQHPFPAQNNQIGCSSPPSPPPGVTGRGGRGGQDRGTNVALLHPGGCEGAVG